MSKVRYSLWSPFIPQTFSSYIRSVSVAAPTLLFGISAFAILEKQAWFRGSLSDEDQATWDRIDRRAYIALPDGRTAQVHPKVETRMTLGNLWGSLVESFSLLP